MKTDQINWEEVHKSLNENGFFVLSQVLNPEECQQLIATYDEPGAFRKTVVMERFGYGVGEYKYFNYPLPDLIQTLRTTLYESIYQVANQWSEALKLGVDYPSNHADFIEICNYNGQNRATPLLLKYGEGGLNMLHQDLYGDVYFPLQAVAFLSEPGEDYTGGEFVLTEQIPRSQSKATVLTPKRGDILLFTTQFRPEKSKRGYYRVTMRHGVSKVHSGNRYTMGIIFHDAK
ncbi:2OG-Fe(II) oxygenase [Larkinella terrae]|uniref:Prolyl 4-hydroxylase subunit alpha n=1 Tax=Larkinella terrae TaxID=2025311 RepID=A0A7K0ETE3_9BACT|nr:2OG-Fe(II) oxygenase [Larkinella terrae]MRS65084.1 prolyl 4-hydroxylase subunit alpha [Larkinella terrae]